MTAAHSGVADHRGWALRGIRPILLGMHVSLVVGPLLHSVSSLAAAGPASILIVMAAAATGLLQLRHSLGTARGERPRGWLWTFPIMAILGYAPTLVLGWQWIYPYSFVIASACMLLRHFSALLGVTALVACTMLAPWILPPNTPFSDLIMLLASEIALATSGIGLYAVARLLDPTGDGQASPRPASETADGSGANIHEPGGMLTDRLAAIAFKGDLALQTIHSDVPATREELRDIIAIARAALKGNRAIESDQRMTTLRREATGASALLAAANVEVRVNLDVQRLPPAAEHVLVSAIRYGVLNSLRHGGVRRCSITAGTRGGTIWLAIVSDGARSSHHSADLDDLANRAKVISGTVSSWRTADHHLHLLVELPRETS